MILIRRADASDADAICTMEQLCFSDPWTREMVAAEFSGENPSRYYAAEEDGALAGYAGVWLVAPEGYITNVAVRPELRRKGIASLLLAELISECEAEGITDFTLEVRTGNEGAKALYRNFGFEEAGIRKRYYSDGEDAAIMWRRANSANNG